MVGRNTCTGIEFSDLRIAEARHKVMSTSSPEGFPRTQHDMHKCCTLSGLTAFLGFWIGTLLDFGYARAGPWPCSLEAQLRHRPSAFGEGFRSLRFQGLGFGGLGFKGLGLRISG